MLQAVELPTGVAHLDPCLPYVDADDLPHLRYCWEIKRKIELKNEMRERERERSEEGAPE